MEFYSIFIASLLLIIALFYCGIRVFKYKKREAMIKNFDSYAAVLQYHMEKAYNMVYKDQVLTYSIEATTLGDKEFFKASFDFIKLVEKLLGPTLLKELTDLYGNYDTFAFNLAEYFNTRYDEDEIRKSSINNMMDSEVGQEET